MAVDPTSTRVDEISDILHETMSAGDGQMLWLALDDFQSAEFPIDGEPPAFGEALQAALPGRYTQRVPLDHAEIDKTRCPSWVSLDLGIARDSFLLQDSIGHALAELEPGRLLQGAGRRVAGWIELDGAPTSAAAHLGRQMLRLHPSGGRTLLRLHDPAVLWAVWPLLTPVQQRALLGDVKRWWLLDPRRELVALQRPDVDLDNSGPNPWTAEQWMDIEHMTAFNDALRQTKSVPDSKSLSRAHTVAMAALRRARSLGFSHANDLALFASHAIDVHPEFDRHDKVREALRSGQPGDDYSALVSSLTASDWDAIRQAPLADASGAVPAALQSL